MNEIREMKTVGEAEEDKERTDELTSAAAVALAVSSAFSSSEGINLVANQVQGLMPRSVHVSMR